MTKPTTKHTGVLIQQIKLLENARNSAVEPKFIKSLERDIQLIHEIRSILFCIIDSPTLPFLSSYDDDPVPVLNQIEQEPNGAF